MILSVEYDEKDVIGIRREGNSVRILLRADSPYCRKFPVHLVSVRGNTPEDFDGNDAVCGKSAGVTERGNILLAKHP